MTEQVKFQCECGQYYKVDRWRIDRTFICPYCEQEMIIPPAEDIDPEQME